MTPCSGQAAADEQRVLPANVVVARGLFAARLQRCCSGGFCAHPRELLIA